MKNAFGLIFLILLSCQSKQENEPPEQASNQEDSTSSEIHQDGLFLLDINLEENVVKIIAPEWSSFLLPDPEAKTKPYKTDNFNADNKEDVMVFLGACGAALACMDFF